MKKLIAVLLLIGFLNVNCGYAKTVKVKAGTPIDFIMTESISSEDAQDGDKIKIKIDDDFIIDGVKVFKKGTEGYLFITTAKKKARWGQGGKIEIDRGKIFDVNGVEHRVDFIQQYQGKEATWAIVTACVGIYTIVLFPLGFFGFVKGKDAQIKANIPLECQISEEFNFSEKL